MEEKMTAKLLVGIIFAFIGGIFTFVGGILVSVMHEIFVWIFPVIGAVFLGLGIAFLYMQAKEKAEKREVVENGYYVPAMVSSVHEDLSITINGRHPWVIECMYTDPENGKVHLFSSENLKIDPTPLLTSDMIRVYIDPQDLSKYYVDTASAMSEVIDHR